MPGVSTSIRASRDGQYIFATGIYKPRLRCYDVNQLSLKFERCFDSEVITFEALSDDYSKVNKISYEYKLIINFLYFTLLVYNYILLIAGIFAL
jgi:hypothetical protein